MVFHWRSDARVCLPDEQVCCGVDHDSHPPHTRAHTSQGILSKNTALGSVLSPRLSRSCTKITVVQAACSGLSTGMEERLSIPDRIEVDQAAGQPSDGQAAARARATPRPPPKVSTCSTSRWRRPVRATSPSRRSSASGRRACLSVLAAAAVCFSPLYTVSSCVARASSVASRSKVKTPTIQ